MITLAIGMPRAGSGWHYNLTNGLMMASGAKNPRDIRTQYRLGSILTEVNCNIGVLSPRRLSMVMLPSLLGNNFTIKAHSGPTPMARLLIRTRQIRPTYIYRDPRDAALSAYEYGQRALAKGRPNAFSHLDTIEKAIDFLAEYVTDWRAWNAVSRVHVMRYETFKSDYFPQAQALAIFLGVDTANPAIQTVLEQFAPEQAKKGDKGLHFHKGQSGRFRDTFTPPQQQYALDVYGDTLREMGYE